MAKRNTVWTEDKLKRYLQEGRGQGEGKDYKPWLTIRDFPSKGRSSRLLGWKTGRIHNFFSDIETRYFYLLDWMDEVLDIREHYPLLDVKNILGDMDDLNFRLFKDKTSGLAYVLTTTFLVTVKEADGNIKYVARSIKTASELNKKRTIEKFEIERRYWERKKVDWGIVTQKDINKIKAKNIEWIHSSLYSSADRGFTEEEITFFCNAFLHRIQDSSKTIRCFTDDFDKECNTDSGTGLFIFKHLVATKKITVDMDKLINLNEKVSNVKINIKADAGVNEVVNY